MMKETSLLQYLKMKDSGHLGRQQRRILNSMIPGVTYTRLELSQETRIPINAVCGRVYEMMEAGALKYNGRIRCSVSGNHVEGIMRVV